jgi:long-chain fatty acid transport protein
VPSPPAARAAALLAALAASSSLPLRAANAGNGLNAIGFGLESNAMAGADVAVARDPFALLTNPAGLAGLRGLHLEIHGGFAHELGIEHEDRFNPPTDVQNDYVPVGDVAVAQSLERLPATLAASFAVTGGAGYDYGRLATPFGGKDRLSSLLGIVRGSLGGGVALTDRLSLGASAGLSYAILEQELFPETSVIDPTDPGRSFVGTEIRDARAHGAGFRLGALYRVADGLALGIAYGSKIDLPVEEGELVADLGGLGAVTYQDVKLDGLAQAQELGLGVAYEPRRDLLLSAELTWLDWSGALGTATVRASDPDDSRAPPVLRSGSTLGWRDQHVLALGAAYRPAEALRLWAGYNHGRNPAPNRHLSPLLVNIGQHHLTAGVAWRPARRLRLGLAVEYLLPNDATYDNPELPFGPDARGRVSYVALHLGLSLALW